MEDPLMFLSDLAKFIVEIVPRLCNDNQRYTMEDSW